jgi:hypothetical protein
MDCYQIKITLMQVRPVVWRSVLAPDTITLSQLHHILQIVMGWEDSHLHRFVIDRRRTGSKLSRVESQVLNNETVSLRSTVGLLESKFLYYEYDFGDGWIHELQVEKASPPTGAQRVLCIGGERCCPPEDCGGAIGYGELLQVLRNPRHSDYEEMLEWVGGSFDPEMFDLKSMNKNLRRLRIGALG